jgi:hypothetical protein
MFAARRRKPHAEACAPLPFNLSILDRSTGQETPEFRKLDSCPDTRKTAPTSFFWYLNCS